VVTTKTNRVFFFTADMTLIKGYLKRRSFPAGVGEELCFKGGVKFYPGRPEMKGGAIPAAPYCVFNL